MRSQANFAAKAALLLSSFFFSPDGRVGAQEGSAEDAPPVGVLNNTDSQGALSELAAPSLRPQSSDTDPALPVLTQIRAPLELTPGVSQPLFIYGGGGDLPHETFQIARRWAAQWAEIAGRDDPENFSERMKFKVTVIPWANSNPDGSLLAADKRFNPKSNDYTDSEPIIPVGSVKSFKEIFLTLKRALTPQKGYLNNDSESVSPEDIELILAAISKEDENVTKVVKEISDDIIASLKGSPVIFISGGVQARLVLMFELFPDVKEFIVTQHRLGRIALLTTSAGTAVVGDLVCLGNTAEQAGEDSGLSPKTLQDLIGETGEGYVLSYPNAGLGLLPGILPDQHGGFFPDGRELRRGRIARAGQLAVRHCRPVLLVTEGCCVIVPDTGLDKLVFHTDAGNPVNLAAQLFIPGHPRAPHPIADHRQYSLKLARPELVVASETGTDTGPPPESDSPSAKEEH